MKTYTIVDLTLHAAATCQMCRTVGRPLDQTDQEHGDQFVHEYVGGKFQRCNADQVWSLIRRLEAS